MYSVEMYLRYITLLLHVLFSLQNIVKIDTQNRIFNGKMAAPHSTPFQVGIWISKLNNQISFCGGSLITAKFVLTAAHCLIGVEDIEVMLGGQSREVEEPDTIFIETKLYKYHENYNPKNLRNDIGIIELPEPVKLTNRIGLINLPKKSDENNSLVGEYAKLTGWGRTSDTASGSDDLIELSLFVLDEKECNGLQQTRKQLCGLGKSNGSACIGDSGSPLILEKTFTQIGLVSYGSKDGCTLGKPHIYTKISSYLDWIQQNSDYKIL